MTHKHLPAYPLTALFTLLLLGGCGGGGGGDGTTPPPPPPPPPAAVSYTVELTDLALEDTRTGAAVDPGGLPVQGARATRNP